MSKEHKTLKRLQEALATTSGMDETVAVIYCDNDNQMYTSAFVGESAALCASINCLLDKIGEGRALPSEVAIAGSMLRAIAASDLSHNGAIIDAINGYKEEFRNQRPKAEA